MYNPLRSSHQLIKSRRKYMTTAVNLVRSFRHLRALVIGDALLDTYLEGTATRLCREGPVPVVCKTTELYAPGGAANTAANLRALDADVIFLGFVGHDTTGTLLRSALRKLGIDDAWLVEDEFASTLHKLRILADGQYVVRFDNEQTHHYSSESHTQLLANLEKAFPSCDLVVVSDYCYGVMSDSIIDRLRALRAAHPKVLLVDSKDLHHFRDVGATVITPNHLEAQFLAEHMPDTSLGIPHPGALARGTDTSLSEIERIGRHLLTMIDTEHVAITMAGDGVFLIDRRGRTLHVPTHPVSQANDVGAGDSFTAAMALALAAGGNIEEAARIALDAASIAVTKRWTAVVHSQELLQRVSLRDHARYSRPRIALSEAWTPEALSQLMTQLDAQRLRGQRIVFTNGVFDILHAGHVQFLRQAKALGDVLLVGINSDRSTQRIKGKHRPIHSEQDRMALVAALDAVDHVILFDEETPTTLIRMLRPHIHVKGGDYADEVLPEAEAVREVGGRIVILPLAGGLSTSSVIDRILALAADERIEVKQ
jgi:D-beta-D-heptose 7-phosphate kinase/D-beta-D-heptose 1-phosphate adenosyltransferase